MSLGALISSSGVRLFTELIVLFSVNSSYSKTGQTFAMA